MSRLVVVALLLSGGACANPGARHPVAADPVRQSPATPIPISADTADVVASPLREETVSARVGQTIGVKPFADGVRWQVTFSNTALALLTPLEHLAAPGNEGWVWKALTPGTTEITLTAIVPCEAPPCAPNPQRVTITLEIKGSV